MIVPLGTQAYRRDGLVPESKLYNFYLEKDESGISPDGTLRIQRPGLQELETLPGNNVRGVAVDAADGTILAVSGTTFTRNYIASGTISGDENVAIVATKFATAICNGESAWIFFEGALAQIAMPDDRQVVDIEQIDSYILLLCPDGRFYWILPGEDTVDPLNFATAESSADAGVAIRRVGDEFWIFGTESIEPWQPTGDADLPFERASGRVMAKGCLECNTVRRFDNTLVWVGSDANVYRGGAVPEVISNPALASCIRNRAGRMSAWTFGIDGHEFYVLSIPGQGTFAYDAATQRWPQFGSDGLTTWRAHVGYDFGSVIYAGSSDSGDLWTVSSDAYDDAGTPFDRIVTGTVPLVGRPVRNDSLTVGVGATGNCVVRLRWRDGQEDYPPLYEEMEVRAPFDLSSVYRLGQPDAPYREIEVSFTTAERVRVAGCIANEAWA